jgi:hypothetical protein
MEDEWITTRDAEAMTGYHPEHLRRLVREGKVTGQKFGILWQVSKKSLLKYLNEASNMDDKRWGPKQADEVQ